LDGTRHRGVFRVTPWLLNPRGKIPQSPCKRRLVGPQSAFGTGKDLRLLLERRSAFLQFSHTCSGHHTSEVFFLIFSFHSSTATPVGQGLLTIEASRPHSDKPHSAGLLWTSDQADAGAFTLQHTTLTRDRHPCPGGIRTHNPNKPAAADPLLRPRGHWDRRKSLSQVI
jgi:hypothetical protein